MMYCEIGDYDIEQHQNGTITIKHFNSGNVTIIYDIDDAEAIAEALIRMVDEYSGVF